MVTAGDLHVVTGAFGYSGRYITARLLEADHRVWTLTNSPNRDHPFGDRVEVHPFDFDRPDRLQASLEGASVLYNTYWVRFNHTTFRYSQAIENTLVLFAAARAAAVGRVIHVSITNPSEDSTLEYFRGKAVLERELRGSGSRTRSSGLPSSSGGEDILINNIAWVLRHLPIFGVFGDGRYRMQPIHVEDFADLAVAQAGERDDCVLDAIGPETFTYRELVVDLSRALGVRRPMNSVHPRVGYAAGWFLGRFLGDVLITRDEIEGLMQNLLATDSPPVGRIKLSAWARQHAQTLDRRYATELGRRRDRSVAHAEAT